MLHLLIATPTALLLANAAGGATDLAILTVGPDAAAVADLQLELDHAAGPRAIDVTRVAQRLSLPGAPLPAVPPATRKRLDELKGLIKDHYYSDNRVEAARALDYAEELLTQYAGSLEIPEVVEFRLLRAAVLLAEGDEAGARAVARQAIDLQPQLEVDTRVFRPDLFELVSKAREEETRMVRVTLQNLSPSAVVYVDARRVPATFTAREGRHRVTVSAPGMRARSQWVQLRGTDQSLSVPLALAFSARDAEWFAGLVSRDSELGDEGANNLAGLAQRLGASRVVLASVASSRVAAASWTRSKPRRVEHSPSYADNRDGHRALRAWVSQQSKPTRATRRPAATGRRFHIAAGAGIATRARTHIPADQAAIQMAWLGVGSRVTVAGESGRWAGALDAGVLSYALDEESTKLQDGTTASVKGGTTLSVQAAGTYRFGPPGGLGIGPVLAAGLEQHRADDLEDANGPLHLLPSHRRVHLDVGASVRVPLGRGGIFGGESSLVASGFLTPVTFWDEDPAGTLGQDPKADLAERWSLLLRTEGKTWGAQIEYIGQIWVVHHSGAAALPTATPLQDVTLHEAIHTATLSITRAF